MVLYRNTAALNITQEVVQWIREGSTSTGKLPTQVNHSTSSAEVIFYDYLTGH